MVQVDIYRSKKGAHDILVIDTGVYLSGTMFDYITQYMNTHVFDKVKAVWFWDDEPECITSCLAYRGIAIRLVGYIDDWEAAKADIRSVVMDALDSVS